MTIPFQSSLLEEATELGDVEMLRQINVIDLVGKQGRYHNTSRKEYGYKAQAKRKAREEIEHCE